MSGFVGYSRNLVRGALTRWRSGLTAWCDSLRLSVCVIRTVSESGLESTVRFDRSL